MWFAALLKALAAMGKGAAAAASAVGKGVGTAASAVGKGAATAGQAVAQGATGVAKGAGKAMEGIGKGVSNVGKSAGEGISKAIQSPANVTGQAASQAPSGAMSAVGSAPQVAGSAPSSAMSAVGSSTAQAPGMGQNIMSQFGLGPDGKFDIQKAMSMVQGGGGGGGQQDTSQQPVIQPTVAQPIASQSSSVPSPAIPEGAAQPAIPARRGSALNGIGRGIGNVVSGLGKGVAGTMQYLRDEPNPLDIVLPGIKGNLQTLQGRGQQLGLNKVAGMFKLLRETDQASPAYGQLVGQISEQLGGPQKILEMVKSGELSQFMGPGMRQQEASAEYLRARPELQAQATAVSSQAAGAQERKALTTELKLLQEMRLVTDDPTEIQQLDARIQGIVASLGASGAAMGGMSQLGGPGQMPIRRTQQPTFQMRTDTPPGVREDVNRGLEGGLTWEELLQSKEGQRWIIGR